MASEGAPRAADRLQFADLERVGPGTPAGRYLRLFWHPVLRARDLRPGQVKPVELLGQKFTVYRGADNVVRVVEFSCPHRRAQLSLGWVEGDSIRCRYHGWKYDSAGRCVEQPNEEQPFCEKVRLKTYPAREYIGLIFAFLGDGAPPPMPRYPDIDRSGVIVTDPPEILPCSYWNRLENDMGHVPWVHRATATRQGWNHYLVLRREAVEETAYGYRATRQAAEGETRESVGLRIEAHFFMPTAFQFWQRTRARGYEGRDLWDTKIVFTVPVNDRTYMAFDVTQTPLEGDEGRAYAEARYTQMEADEEVRWDLADKILAGEMTLEELPADLQANTCFIIEDYVTLVSQGALADRDPEWLARSDAKPILLRQMYMREIEALVAGRPLKAWKIPETSLRPQVSAGAT